MASHPGISDRVLRLAYAVRALCRPSRWAPMLNIELEGSYLLEVRLPGVTPEEVKIDLHGRELLISGHSAKGRKSRSIRRGRRQGGEIRYFVTFAKAVNPAGATASWRHGYLTIRVPKGAPQGANWISLAAESV